MDVKKINAQNDMLMVQGNVGRQRGQLDGSKVLSNGGVVSCTTLDGSNVRAIEDVGAPDVRNGDGAIA